MCILYLDIDGVLNHYGLGTPWERPDGTIQQPTSGTQTEWRSGVGMDTNAIKNLNLICKITKCKIVISSAWGYSQDTVDALLHFGFEYKDMIIGGTINGYGRGNQILNTHMQNTPDDYCIVLEDEPYDINGEHDSVTPVLVEFFKNKVYSPNPYIGLTEELTTQIIGDFNDFQTTRTKN